MVLGDILMLGYSGDCASIKVTGLQSTDSAYATNGTKTRYGSWINPPQHIYKYLKWHISNKRSNSDNSMQLADFCLKDLNGNTMSWSGTTVTSSLSGYPGELIENILDGNTSTKYCTIEFTLATGCDIIFYNPISYNLNTYCKYSYYTANDLNNRDPISWTLSGSNDGTTWTTLSTVENATIPTSRKVLAGTWEIPIESSYYLIDKIDEYGTWNVVTSTGVTRDVLVDQAVMYTVSALNYIFLEYVESSGTQYIDTGIYPTDQTKMVIDFINLEITGENIIGNKGTGESDSFRFFNYSSRAYLDYGSGDGQQRIYGGYIYANTRYYLEIGNRYVKNLYTGSNIISGSTVSFTQKAYTICINGNSDFSKNRWYSCKIYNGSTLVGDFIPCKRPDDNAIGFYDTVTEEFFENDGTGTFIAGPETLPDGYTKVQYIQSSGTQYIDTGIPSTYNISSELEFMCVSVESTSHSQLAGGVGWQDQYMQIGYGGSSGTSTIYINYGNNSYAVSSPNVSANSYISVKQDKNKFYINGTLVNTFATSSFSTNYNLYMFAYNRSGVIDEKTIDRIFYCKICDGDTLVRYFVPCTRDSDSAAGMYDLVTRAFFGNDGTGSFTPGPEVET